MNLLRSVLFVLLCLGAAFGRPRRYCGFTVHKAIASSCKTANDCKPLPDKFAYNACAIGYTKEELSSFCCPEF